MVQLNLLRPRLKPAHYRTVRLWSLALSVAFIIDLLFFGAGSYLRILTGPMNTALQKKIEFSSEVNAKAGEIAQLNVQIEDAGSQLAFVRGFAPKPFHEIILTMARALPSTGRISSLNLSDQGEFVVAGSLANHADVADYMDNLRETDYGPYFQFSNKQYEMTTFSLHGTLLMERIQGE